MYIHTYPDIQRGMREDERGGKRGREEGRQEEGGRERREKEGRNRIK